MVDACTAMIDERPYRKALSPDEALEELQRHAPTQFDPAVVAAFLRVVKSDDTRGGRVVCGPIPRVANDWLWLGIGCEDRGGR